MKYSSEAAFVDSSLAVPSADSGDAPSFAVAVEFVSESGDLLVFALPFGSFAPDQAPVEIEMFLDFSPLADLDQPDAPYFSLILISKYRR